MNTEIINPEYKILDLKTPIQFRSIDKSKINKIVNTVEEKLDLLEKKINNSYLSKESELLSLTLYDAEKLTICLVNSDLFHYAGFRQTDIIKYDVSNYVGNIPKLILEYIKDIKTLLTGEQ
jgi:hypothetical protein